MTPTATTNAGLVSSAGSSGGQPVGLNAASAPAAVTARGLRKTFVAHQGRRGQRVNALDDVDLTVREGELLVLLGPSGCGKTTLLRSVAGLEKPDQGEITIGGSVVFSSEKRINLGPERRRIGMMFQSYALWPHMTVFANVAFPLQVSASLSKAETRERVEALLDRLGLEGLGGRYPSQLSGGQQQRVALARSLIAEPSVILFDEPLSNVDARVRRRLREQLRQMRERVKFAGIYVTHDQEEAMELADRLAVMSAGRIVQIAEPREVYASPANRYVADFVGDINTIPATVDRVTDQHVRFTTDAGDLEIRLPRDHRLTAGSTGDLGFRPEAAVITTGSGGDDGLVRLTGVVSDSVFLGPRAEVRVTVGGQSVKVVHDGSATAPVVGSPITVGVPHGAWYWLAE